MTLDELKRENEILKDALCLEQDRLSFARHHLQNAQDRIKQLEDRIHRAAMAFFRDGSDGHVASQMLQILEEERRKQ